MKKMKRLVALFVVLATLASLCTFSLNVSAEDVTEAPVYDITEEEYILVEKLEAMGLIKNEYDPTTAATRRQMANIICSFMNLSVDGSGATKTPFRDVKVDDVDFAAIKALYDLGVVTGDDQLAFHPDRSVTYDEALVFIINAIGYKEYAQRDGGYPTGYHRVAIQQRMLKGLSMKSGKDSVKVIDVYRMLEAAMNSATIEYTYYGDDSVSYRFSDTETYLSDRFGIKEYQGRVTGNEFTRKNNPSDTSLTDEQIQIYDGEGNKVYDTPGYIYEYFLGYTVDYYVRVDSATAELIYIEEAEGKNEVVRIDSEDISYGSISGDRIYYKDENNAKKDRYVDLAGGYDVVYNKQYYRGFLNLENLLKEDEFKGKGYIEVLDNNGDGAYDVLFVYEYDNYVVKSLDSYGEKFIDELRTKDGHTEEVSLDSFDGEVTIKATGDNKKKTFADIAIGDVLSIFASKGSNPVQFVYISQNVLDGKITGYDSELGWEIDKKYYEVAADVKHELENPEPPKEPVLKVGLSGCFYLDMNNKIVKYGYSLESDKYAVGVLQGVHAKTTGFSPEAKVRIFARNGKFYEYNIADNFRLNNVRKDMTDDDVRDAVITELEALISVGPEVIKYIANETEITAIQLAGTTPGLGQFSALARAWQEATVRQYGMIQLREYPVGSVPDEENPSLITKYNNANPIVFMIPEDTEDLERYTIASSIKSDHIYVAKDTSYTKIGDISVYSLGTTTIPVGEVIMMRGVGAGSLESSPMSIVTSITDAVDSNDMSGKKLYLDGSAVGILSDTVALKGKYPDGSKIADDNFPTANLFDGIESGTNPELRVGYAVQTAANADGIITTIQLVADFASATPAPLFYAANDENKDDKYMGGYCTITYFGDSVNSQFMGQVVDCDSEAGAIIVDINGTNYSFGTGAINAKRCIYDVSTGKAKTVNVETLDIQSGDWIVAKVKQYFTLSDAIIFRP